MPLIARIGRKYSCSSRPRCSLTSQYFQEQTFYLLHRQVRSTASTLGCLTVSRRPFCAVLRAFFHETLGIRLKSDRCTNDAETANLRRPGTMAIETLEE